MMGWASTGAGVGERPGRARRALFVALAILCLILFFPMRAPAFVIAACLAIVLGFLPGLLVAPHLARGWTGGGRVLIALALSPFLVGGMGTAFLWGGMTTALAGRAILALLALTSLLAAARPPAGARPLPAERGRGERHLFMVAAAWTALMAFLLLLNPNLIPRSDGWFHAAVTGEIAQRGLPPEDPFFAGLPLLYFWGSHVWAALWPALQPGLTVWAPLVVLNVSGSLATLIGVMLLARRLGAGTQGMKVAALVATLGYAPFAWGWIAARAAAGGVRGWPEIARIAGGGIAPALGTMGTGLLHLSMVFFGGKFLVMTPFGLGLAIFLAFVLAAIEFVASPALRAGILLLLLTGSALFVHTFVGLCCLAVVGGWWICWFVGAVRPRGAQPLDRRLLLGVPAAVLGGVLLVTPYLISILHGKQGQLAAGLGGKSIVTLLWGGAAIVPAGVVHLWKRRADGSARLVLVFAILLAIAGVFVDPSDNNQSKFMNLLFLLLAAPAGQGWIDIGSRLRLRARAVLIALSAAAIAPTVLLSVWAYACEPGRRGEAGGEATRAEREAFAWAQRHTPADAVFVEEGSRRDAAVLAGRSVLWGGSAWAKKWGYPPAALEIRERAAGEMLSGEELSSEVARFLEEMDRPVVVVDRAADESVAAGRPMTEGAKRETDHPIYDREGVKLIMVREGR